MKKLIYILLILMLFIGFTGCKTRIQYVPLIEKQIEYKDRLRIDSIHNTDSIIIRQKNDTIYFETIKIRNKYRTDTVSVIQRDSVPYPVEVIEYVNELTKWQRMRLNAFNVILGFIALLIAYKLIRIR